MWVGPEPIWLMLLKEEAIRTQIHTERRPCEDTGESQEGKVLPTGIFPYLFQFLVAPGIQCCGSIASVSASISTWSCPLLCFFSRLLIRTLAIGLRAHLANPGWVHLKICQLHLQRPYFQRTSHSQVLGIRKCMCHWESCPSHHPVDVLCGLNYFLHVKCLHQCLALSEGPICID